MASLVSGLRRTAPKLSRDFFLCHQCLSKALPARSTNIAGKSTSLWSIRYKSSASIKSRAGSNVAITSKVAPVSQVVEKAQSAANGKFFPETSSRTVGYWLLGSAASVFGIVVFGGLTRLTESGLSITEWKPVTGAMPPRSDIEWMSEFEKYRASPEFSLLNPNMDLDEFKKIYYMEWGHRLWGRFVGLSFVIPAIYFVARRKVSANMSLRLLGITGLIGAQGAIGWWMVKSGLKDDLFAPGSHPRVSQYRLTAHLGTAFLCYTAMLWNGLSILRDYRNYLEPARGNQVLQRVSSPQLSIFRKSVAGLALLVFTTAMSGGLVAGLDAGLIYNEFPYMGNGLTPPKTELFDKFYSRRPNGSDLWWRNMLENPSTVQLDHRILATTTFTAIMALWAYSRFSPIVHTTLPKSAKRGMLGVVHLVSLQVILGISTLVYLVPVPLAAAHQAGSLALLTGVLVLGNRVWVPKRSLRLVQQRFKQVKKGTSAPPARPGLVAKAMKEEAKPPSKDSDAGSMPFVIPY